MNIDPAAKKSPALYFAMYLLFHTFCRLSSMKRNVDTKKNIIFVLEYFSSFFHDIKISLILRLRKIFLRILI